MSADLQRELYPSAWRMNVSVKTITWYGTIDMKPCMVFGALGRLLCKRGRATCAACYLVITLRYVRLLVTLVITPSHEDT